MHMKIIKSFWIILLFITVLISLNNTVHALPCDYGGVSDSVKCQDGINNNDQVSFPLTVNTEIFFGYDDWIYLQKNNNGSMETNINVDWTVIPEDGAWTDDKGTWSFSSAVWDNYEDVMIVVKSGINEDTYFSGYLMDSSIAPVSGTWDTGGKDLSHLTLYARNPIPEPGTLMLLGSGLLGVAAYGRKRFKK